MKKIVTQILIAAFTLGCLPAYADDDSSSSSSGGGGGVGIAIGAAAIIGLLVWALSDKKEPETPAVEVVDPMAGQVKPSIETPALEEQPRLTAPASGGVGNVKGMEY
ncbi:hypothetical protein [Polynucleobacter necessarius]|uniref:hypothetical protein n=1 Tax=Polynucleobacter necessarius TaxID=576610 RepID=UPI000E0954D3|nr:hypothetical protein [Polynucleobacter necessarius]